MTPRPDPHDTRGLFTPEAAGCGWIVIWLLVVLWFVGMFLSLAFGWTL